MKLTIDDEVIFEQDVELEIKSFQRAACQRSAAGLDGQVNIDLGLRGRKLVQKGRLLAESQTELQKKIDEINRLFDGSLHTLKCCDERIFENLLIEDFSAGPFIRGGAQTSCQYNITYIQQV
jgi:hypothetical protein